MIFNYDKRVEAEEKRNCLARSERERSPGVKDSRDDEPSRSAPPRGFEVDLTKIQEEEELSSGRATYFSDMHKRCDESDSSDDEAGMRWIAKRMTRKIPRRSHQTENGGVPCSSVVARVSIDRIYDHYGRSASVASIINKMKDDRRNGTAFPM
jgi:hypothetical protein